MAKRSVVLDLFNPAVADWFRSSFESPTPPQQQGWPAIARGDSTLILAPTGSGKTLTAFLWAIDRVMFPPPLMVDAERATVDKPLNSILRRGTVGTRATRKRRADHRSASARVLYISPLKALAVDVERNLRAPIAGIANRAEARGDAFHLPTIAVRTGDTPAIERARF